MRAPAGEEEEECCDERRETLAACRLSAAQPCLECLSSAYRVPIEREREPSRVPRGWSQHADTTGHTSLDSDLSAESI